MTMRLTLKNEDQSRTARVTTLDVGGAANTPAEIAPGETKDFWIHAGRTLTVEELQPKEGH